MCSSDLGTVKAQMIWIRSTDSGQNWSQPAIVGPSSLPEFPHDSLSLQVLPHTAALNDDELFVVWLGKTDATSILLLHAIQSLNGGASWGEITNPSDAPDDATLNHIAPSTVVHQGQVQTAWLDKRVAGWYYPYTSRFAEPATSNTIYLPAVQNAPFTPTNTDSIAGEWTGTITNNKNGTSRLINVSVKISCGFGAVCGSFSLPNSSCKGDLYLNDYNTGKFVFAEQNITGPSSCLTPGVVHLNSGSGGSLVYEAIYSQYTAGGFPLKYNGTLSHP